MPLHSGGKGFNVFFFIQREWNGMKHTIASMIHLGVHISCVSASKNSAKRPCKGYTHTHTKVIWRKDSVEIQRSRSMPRIKRTKETIFLCKQEQRKHIVVWQREGTLEGLLKSILPLMFSRNLCSFPILSWQILYPLRCWMDKANLYPNWTILL